MACDYAKMLRAYIAHVFICEGADYIEWYPAGGTPYETDLTDEEREEIQKISREAHVAESDNPK